MRIDAAVGDEIVVDFTFMGQPPRKGEVLEILGGPGHEHLLHHRLAAEGRDADAGRVHRHGAVAEHAQTQPGGGRVDEAPGGGAGGGVFGQVGLAHAVGPGLGQLNVQSQALL